MTVYVDDVAHPFGRMLMCHMWADTLEELIAMADMIGVSRRWLQQPPKASWVHFDVSLGKKATAIRLGAVLTDKFGPVEHCANLDIASGEPDRVRRGEHHLHQVATARALRRTAETPRQCGFSCASAADCLRRPACQNDDRRRLF